MKKKFTKVIIPSITFNHSFKNKKEARKEALRVLLAAIANEDRGIVNQIKVSKVSKI